MIRIHKALIFAQKEYGEFFTANRVKFQVWVKCIAKILDTFKIFRLCYCLVQEEVIRVINYLTKVVRLFNTCKENQQLYQFFSEMSLISPLQPFMLANI
ncbi:hypothetical protein BpHYR1_054400 [Brachionus plicatilis]|uniref:Uncharacterized protein n=1 Tax=Brachionus plicatilis TaxID=10195 RepID=A0A3M7P317_BRAPC|nr:hypothetical protein BpHYR1_054400 [Brachionus plicatilis]